MARITKASAALEGRALDVRECPHPLEREATEAFAYRYHVEPQGSGWAYRLYDEFADGSIVTVSWSAAYPTHALAAEAGQHMAAARQRLHGTKGEGAPTGTPAPPATLAEERAAGHDLHN